ncbi:MAG: hypothetical protein GYA15_13755 [Leptolinea sp.]|jgi:hypothetical protein|nr:hypothetical protein [Leptolinea sp.]
MSVDSIWMTTAFILTLGVIVSYLIGEKFPPFKVISYLFIGIAAGYAASVAIFQVIYPRLIIPLMYPSFGYSRLASTAAIILALLLLFKVSPRLSKIGNIATGIIVGATAGVIIGGAVLGTVFSQAKAAVSLFNPELGTQPGEFVDALFMLIGTVSTLVYFQFGGIRRPGKPVDRPKATKLLAGLGKFFIAITLGALFAGVISAAMSVLAERMGFLVRVIQSWIH